MEHVERDRIIEEYRRREAVIGRERYERSNPAETFIRHERTTVARQQLEVIGRFPTKDTPCLEIGCGRSGWLPELRAWNVRESNLYGVDLAADRLVDARTSLPGARLAQADARSLPVRDGLFELVVLSTVLSSVLDPDVRARICSEAIRVLHPKGALLVYDFRVDNPTNPNVNGVTIREVKRLFAPLEGRVRRVTLLPPLLRRLLPGRPGLARLLSTLPPLRTHFMACFSNGGAP